MYNSEVKEIIEKEKYMRHKVFGSNPHKLTEKIGDMNTIVDYIELLEKGMLEFIGRVEDGSIRSKKTYAKFKEILGIKDKKKSEELITMRIVSKSEFIQEGRHLKILETKSGKYVRLYQPSKDGEYGWDATSICDEYDIAGIRQIDFYRVR